MSRHKIQYNTNESFICVNCGNNVLHAESGTHYRNHCPHCLFSLHVDIHTGDRRSRCMGLMEPIGIWSKKGKEWALIHRCVKCGIIKTNRIAADDNEMVLILIAAKPFMSMPFPAESVLNRPFLINVQNRKS